MHRRDFLMYTAAGAAAMPAARNAIAQDERPPAPPLDNGTPAQAPASKLARISIMTYNFDRRLKLEGQPPSPDRILEVFDLPQMYADVYGVHNIEFQHSHFVSTEPSYLKEVRARIEKVKSRMTQINVEFDEGAVQQNISAENPAMREQAIDLTARWVDHAVILGCPRVMVNQGRLTAESLPRATATIKRMGEYAKSKGVKISVETRGGGFGGRRGARGGQGRGGDTAAAGAAPTPAPAPPAAPPGPAAWTLVQKLVEDGGCYSNCDIGGVGARDQEALHAGIKSLFPSSSGNMHIKESQNWDLGTAIKFINSELGYKGLYSIEVNTTRIRPVYETILANI
jgi:hypothetical protein